MTIKDCLQLAALFLNDEEAEAALLGEPAPDEAQHTVDQLLRCANLVLHEIAAEYVPLFARERITIEGGTFELTRLKKRLLHLYSVMQNGAKRKHICRFGVLTAASGDYDVLYSYIPDALGLDDALPFDERVSARLIGYGTAAEYAMISGLESEAALFDKRYKDALHAASIQRTEKRIKKRRWL